MEADHDAAVQAIEFGTLEDASAAAARLLTVTQATLERRAQLQGALESRVAIEQAKGIVAERHGLEVDDAFRILRGAARSNRLKLRDLAQRVRPGEPDPPEIAQKLEALRGDV